MKLAYKLLKPFIDRKISIENKFIKCEIYICENIHKVIYLYVNSDSNPIFSINEFDKYTTFRYLYNFNKEKYISIINSIYKEIIKIKINKILNETT